MTTPIPPLPTCPNPACEQPHVIRNGSSKGRRRYLCRGCGRFFGETEGTPMYRLHTKASEVALALLIVMRRGSLRAAEEITGHKYETIGEWLRRASQHADALTAILMQDLHPSTVEIDEFWSFVRKKNGSPDEADAGERWGCLVQDRPSRFIIACATGRIGDDLVERAVTLTVARTQGRSLTWCSDGWRGYAAVLRRAYHRPGRSGKSGRPPLVVPADVRLTQLIKHRGEHGKLLAVEIRATLGEVVPNLVPAISNGSTAPSVIGLMRSPAKRMLSPNGMPLLMHSSTCSSSITTSIGDIRPCNYCLPTGCVAISTDLLLWLSG